MPKAVTDAQIIGALIDAGSIKAAADIVGLTQSALRRRTAEREFKALFKQAQADITRQASLTANRKLNAALEVVTGIMENPEAAPAERLRAAQLIIDSAAKLSERTKAAEQDAEQTANAFFDWV